MWFEIEWYSYGPMFECLVISWWNCLGKNEDACSFWRRCVTGRGFWCFKSSCQVHFLSLIHLQLRDRCKLWGTAPAQRLQTAMHSVIMVMYTSSESINKSLIKCFILYVSLVMVVLCSNRKISKKILDWLICFQIIQASLQLITELRVTLNYRSLCFSLPQYCVLGLQAYITTCSLQDPGIPEHLPCTLLTESCSQLHSLIWTVFCSLAQLEYGC